MKNNKNKIYNNNGIYSKYNNYSYNYLQIQYIYSNFINE